MTESHRHDPDMDAKIWGALLAILLLFTGVILYARHINLTRQEEAARAPVVARYSNLAYGVNLRYPPEWRPASGGPFDRYEGVGGFFGISAGGAGDITLDGMVVAEITNPSRPYGKEPYVQSLTIDNQSARLIMPSLDQAPTMNGQAVLIVEYPQPMTIGFETYKFLVFFADRANIQDIASSITFIRPQR